jgi:hypothetical protein
MANRKTLGLSSLLEISILETIPNLIPINMETKKARIKATERIVQEIAR